MDFAALMNKELSKAKKPSDSSSKFLKRSEIEEERKAKYAAEQKALQEERSAKEAAKRKREDDIAAENKVREEKRRKLAEESRQRREEQEEEEERARRKHLGLPELVKKDENGEQNGGAAEDDMPEEVLREKLRELGQPVMLFGETHRARIRRHKRLTVVMTEGPIPTTLKLVDEKDMKVDTMMPKDIEGKRYLFRQLASYFTMVLSEYEKTMEQEKNDSATSQVAYGAMVQTRENLKPVSSFVARPKTTTVILTRTAVSQIRDRRN